MSRTKTVLLVLLLLIGAPITVVLVRPDLVLRTLASPTLSELGYEISELEVLHLGVNGTAIDRMDLLSNYESISLNRIQVQYSLSQLLAGTVQSVAIGRVEVRALATAATVAEPTSLSAMLETFDALPLQEIVIPNIEMHSSDQSYTLGMGLQSPPLQLVGEARFVPMQDMLVEFDLQRSGATTFSLATTALLSGDVVLESDADLAVAQNAVTVSATNIVFIKPLRSQLEQLLPAATSIANDRFTLQSNFEVQEIFGDFALPQLSVTLDSTSAQLGIRQASDLGGNSVQIRLPLRMEGALDTASGELHLALSEIVASGSWGLDDMTAQSEHGFTNTRVDCLSFANCALLSDWRSSVSSWRYADYLGANTSAAAALRFNYSNDEMRLASDLVTIAIPSITGPAESTLSNLSTRLHLDELEFRVGDVISGGFNFNSDELRADNSLVDISNPHYSGKLQLEDDVLTGILELDLDHSLRLGIGLQHFFLRDTGDVVLQLAAHEFSDAQPLSALLKPKQVDADLVAGQIEGLANISWSKQLDESWRFGGPIALKISELSGYYTDTLFVDFSTELFAEATTPPGIQVSNPASATLSRVDIGLPLENLSWQYRFNTLSQEVQINDFDTALLGGKLSIPAARYNPNRDRQQIDVVIADVRVDSLVNLAEYPELRADGLLSGYLPIIIEGDSLTIERGLVGALQPGGSIRYTPANSVPSSNQSVQLVNQALSNYQYQTMNTLVSYFENGELSLSVELRGRNPDMNNGQMINLNLNISDNIPSLLKSLQASRVITDELERHVGRP